MAIRIVEVTSTPKRIDVAEASGGFGTGTGAVTGRNVGNLASPTTEHRYSSWPFLAVGNVTDAQATAGITRATKLFEYVPREEITIKPAANEQVWAFCLIDGARTELRLDDVIT